jgi:hypothetical protein
VRPLIEINVARMANPIDMDYKGTSLSGSERYGECSMLVKVNDRKCDFGRSLSTYLLTWLLEISLPS